MQLLIFLKPIYLIISLFQVLFFSDVKVKAGTCTAPAVSCYSTHYLATYNLCECCTYPSADTSTYTCAGCLQPQSNGPPGMVSLSYYIMSSDEQICERTSEGSSPGSRSPSNFAAVSVSDTKNLGFQFLLLNFIL